MSTEVRKSANMPKLILLYVATLIMAIAVGYGVTEAWWRFTGKGAPVIVLFYIVPMIGAMLAGKQYTKDTGQRASFGYSLVFGLITAALVTGLVYGVLETGLLDPVLHQIDGYAMENGMRMRVYQPLLIIIGGLALFVNVVMFWVSTIGEVKRQARLAAKNG